MGRLVSGLGGPAGTCAAETPDAGRCGPGEPHRPASLAYPAGYEADSFFRGLLGTDSVGRLLSKAILMFASFAP